MKLWARIITPLFAAFLLAFSALGAYAQPVASSNPLTVTAPCDAAGLQAAIDNNPGATLTLANGCTIALTGNPIEISNNITLDGTGSHITITRTSDGPIPTGRLITTTLGSEVTLKNLTFEGGNDTSEASGGAIYNAGTLTVKNSTFSGNTTNGFGGAIYSALASTLYIENSTFYNNYAEDGGGAVAAYSTTPFYTSITATIINSTFVDNYSSHYGDSGAGNTIFIGDNTDLTLTNSLISSSYGSNCEFGGANLTRSGNLTYNNDESCGTATSGNLGLAEGLANNGGVTQTFALLSSSPAIDFTSGCPDTDQRGVERDPSGCDVGAYEYVVTTSTALGANPSSGLVYGTLITFTATVSPNPGGGTVTFKDGSTVLNPVGAAVNSGTGVATFSTSALSAGSHSITATYDGAKGLYSSSVSTPAIQLSIAQAPLEITADSASKVYGTSPDPALTFQITGGALANGNTKEIVFFNSLARAAGENAGTYKITQGTLSVNANYTLAKFTGADFTITPKEIAVTADAQSKIYGNADTALTYTYASTPGISDASFTGALSRAPGEAVGSYAILQHTLALTSAYSTNYSIKFTGANLEITPRPLTITVAAASPGKVYGDTEPVIGYTVSGTLIGTDAISGALGRATGQNAGSYAINLGSLSAGDNYALSLAADTPSFVISKKAISVAAEAKTKTYGAADPDLTYTFSPALVAGDTFTGSLARAAGEGAGKYAITQNNLALSTNYTLSYTGANLTIDPKAITVTADAKSKVYDEVDPALTFQITSGSLVNTGSIKDTIDSVFSGALVRATGNAIGRYAISQGTLQANANYAMTFVGADFDITKRKIAVMAQAQRKTYGDADPDLTFTFAPTDGISPASFTGSLACDKGAGIEQAGTHPITIGSLALIDSLTNGYEIAFTGADLTIDPKAITVTADAQRKIYGEADPAFTYRITSGALVNHDTLAGVFSGALERTSGESVNTYAISRGTLGASTNYALSFVGANLEITKREVTISADAQRKTYGAADPALTYSVSPALASGDSLAGALKRMAGEDAGSYAIEQNTLALPSSISGNYTLHFTGANLTIDRAKLTFTADNKTRQYDEANPALTYQVNGFEWSDSEALLAGKQPALDTSAKAGSLFGAYPIQISAGDLPELANYEFVFVNGTLTIEGKRIYLPIIGLNVKP